MTPRVRPTCGSRLCFALLLSLWLVGCTTYLPQRYVSSASTQAALALLGTHEVAVGRFVSVEDFDSLCRLAGFVSAPDGMTMERYIQRALQDELSLAGWLHLPTPQGQPVNSTAPAPTITLSATLEEASFSSMRLLTGARWSLRLRVQSSNGRAMQVAEEYQSHSGFSADIACKQTAEALLPSVQNLLRSLVVAPRFGELLQTPGGTWSATGAASATTR